MAHNSRTRISLVAWSGGAVAPSEFENLDQNGFTAINGDDGGVWAPADPIEVGGAGFIASGPFESTDDADFSGVVTMTAGLRSEFETELVDLVTIGDTALDTL